ncbi:hypothetical protein QE152_g5949 [Popillia japonica]|uniref:Uncharacterized protein n=1 Tax=Popillia japonica TaxID=7064 RepID=A0AAW1MJV4_POPJA
MYHRRYQPMLVATLPNVNNQISNRLFGMSGKLREFNGTIQGSRQISNRLFGMSGKLREFNGTIQGSRYQGSELNKAESTRWGSLNELTQKFNSTENNLKSVIKKEENNKRKNDKKVTFSAYTTVQVV